MKIVKGFSLIEVMIAVVIVGILAGIAYPNYQDYMFRARRSDAQISLLDMQARMERFFAQNNTYVGATPAAIGVSTTTPEGFYTLSITNLAGTTYTLNAAPIAGQAQENDSCTTLTLTHTNIKGPTPATCW